MEGFRHYCLCDLEGVLMLDLLKLVTFEFVRRLDLKKGMVRLKLAGGYLEWVLR